MRKIETNRRSFEARTTELRLGRSHPRSTWKEVLLLPGFELQMAYAAIVLVPFSLLGFQVTGLEVPLLGMSLLTLILLMAGLSPLVLYLHQEGKRYWFDLVVIAYCALFFSYTLNFPILLAARAGIIFNLWDAKFVRLDRSMGIQVPDVMAWALNHSVGRVANGCYPLLPHFMKCAVFVPPLLNKAKDTQRFLRASLIAFAIGMPLFALFPAVGPWYGYHTPGKPGQVDAEALLLLLRHPGPCRFDGGAGIVCFPSFHVVWAILCTQALWGLRFLRIPVVIFAGLIILSTVTMGEHYLIDLVAGAVVAGIAAWTANWLGSFFQIELSETDYQARRAISISAV